MQEQQSGAGNESGVLEYQKSVRSEQAVESQEKVATTAFKSEAECELEEFAQAEQERKERRRLKNAELEEVRQASWRNFMDNECREIESRKSGQLVRLLETILAGESPDVMRQLVHEDQKQANEGVVALVRDGKFDYKKLEDLTIEDKPARIAASRIRTTWLKERADSWSSYGG